MTDRGLCALERRCPDVRQKRYGSQRHSVRCEMFNDFKPTGAQWKTYNAVYIIYPYTQHHLGERLEVCRFAVVFFPRFLEIRLGWKKWDAEVQH